MLPRIAGIADSSFPPASTDARRQNMKAARCCRPLPRRFRRPSRAARCRVSPASRTIPPRRERSTSEREDRASRHPRARAHAHPDRIGERESTGATRMAGNQPDPPRAERAKLACRCMAAGRALRARAAMQRIAAIAASRQRRVTMVHFWYPVVAVLLVSASGRPRRSGDSTTALAARRAPVARAAALPVSSIPAVFVRRAAEPAGCPSSTFAPRHSQGARQARAGPSPRGFRRTTCAANRRQQA